jgi:DNA-binding NarL/FixJ family response regulator
MVNVAIYSADSSLRHTLERLLRGARTVTVIGVAADPQAVDRLIEQANVDAVLVDEPPRAQLNDWLIGHRSIAFIVLLGETETDEALEAVLAGARAILPRRAGRGAIVAAIEAAANGLTVLPRHLLETLLDTRSPEAPLLNNLAGETLLTPREIEVLTAMADGASNKAIARRLGISFHTAKFHVAAILAKLDADSRTEAVARAAHLGLVML